MHCIAFSPLGHSDPGVINDEVMKEVAQELGRTSAQVRLQPHVDIFLAFLYSNGIFFWAVTAMHIRRAVDQLCLCTSDRLGLQQWTQPVAHCRTVAKLFSKLVHLRMWDYLMFNHVRTVTTGEYTQHLHFACFAAYKVSAIHSTCMQPAGFFPSAASFMCALTVMASNSSP